MRDRTLHDGPFAPALREAADALISGRATTSDTLLLDLLRERRLLREAQLVGLSHLRYAIVAFEQDDDNGCWRGLLEAMLTGDRVAEIREKIFLLQLQVRPMFPPGLSQVTSEILLMGVNEWMW